MQQTARVATATLLVAALAALTACSPPGDQATSPTPAAPAAVTAQASPAAPARPEYVLPSAEAFDAAAVPPYRGDHAAVYAHIDANLDEHLANIQRWLRQPSISALDIGVRDMAEMVRGDLERIGFQEAAIVETDGHPGVWGYYDAGAERTLMLYLMYDVQPVGEEELGSPHYPQIVDQYEERLRTADGVIFPFNSQAPDGSVSLNLGVKGILYFEAEASGGDWGGPREAEIHGSYKAIVDAPVWRLVQALSTLVSEDGNTILVPGYYDGVRPPTAEEASLIAGLLASHDDARLKDTFKVGRWIDGMSGEAVLRNLIYTPTLNIDGIYGGYTGEGVKTILPHMATAKMDSRLPVGLDPDEAFDRIRSHLDANGYEDIVLRKLSSYPASQTSVHTPLVQAVIGVFNKHGATPTVNPRLAGSAPFYQFTERLGLPMVPTGFGFGTDAHAPNEFMLIEPAAGVGAAGLAAVEKGYVDMLYALAAPEQGE